MSARTEDGWSRGLVGGLACLALTALAGAMLPTQTLARHIELVDIDRTVRVIGPHGAALARGGLATLSVLAGILAIAGAFSLDRIAHWLRITKRDLGELTLRTVADARATLRDLSLGERAMLTVAFAVGLGLRIETLRLPVSYDEAHTYVLFASRTLLDVISDYTMPNNQILHTILARLSLIVVDDSLVSLRLPALMAGLVLVPTAFLLLARLFDPQTASFGTALVAVAPPLVEYSGQARGYSLVTLFFAAAFLLATLVVQRSSRSGWVLLTAALALGLYSIPTMLYGVVAIFVWMWLSVGVSERLAMARALILCGLSTGALALLLYLPAVVGGRLPHIPGTAIQDLPAAMSALSGDLAACWGYGLPVWGRWALVAGTLVALASMPRVPSVRALTCSVLAVLLLIVVQRAVPPARALHFLFPVVAGLSVSGLRLTSEAIAHRVGLRRGVASAGLALVMFGAWTTGSVGRIRQEGVSGRAEPGASCVGGYFQDAAAIAERVAPELRSGSILIAREYSGVVESVRYYLMTQSISPLRVRPYVDGDRTREVERYPQSFIVVPGAEVAASDLLEMLDTSRAELASRFESPEVILSLRSATVFLLRPLRPQPPPTEEELRRNISYAW